MDRVWRKQVCKETWARKTTPNISRGIIRTGAYFKDDQERKACGIYISRNPLRNSFKHLAFKPGTRLEKNKAVKSVTPSKAVVLEL